MELTRIERAPIVVTLGPGGVGKTTTAAALALRLATSGHRALVCTVDPARRLASSLGLVGLGDEPKRVEPDRLRAAGLPPETHLDAVMLDPESTLDRMLLQAGENRERAEALRRHPLYLTMARELPGMYEYAAIARLYELRQERRWDRILLDTPPTTHALDFLDAPRRLMRALESPAVGWLVRPYLKAGRFSLKLLGGARAYIFRRLAQIVGIGLLEQMAEFLVLFEGVLEGVRQRTEDVNRLLAGEEVAYLVVTAPTQASVGEAAALFEQLDRRRLKVSGLVMNRVHERHDLPRTDPGAMAEALAGIEAVSALPAETQVRLLGELLRCHDRYQRLAEADARLIEQLLAQVSAAPQVATVPLGSRDIHDLDGLWWVARYL